jgi:hypothetical protein
MGIFEFIFAVISGIIGFFLSIVAAIAGFFLKILGAACGCVGCALVLTLVIPIIIILALVL